MKNIIIKILTTLLILGIFSFTTYTYYKFIQTKNFNILNERESMIIEIPNGKYIEITAKNDTVYDKDTEQKPFSTYTQIQKNTQQDSAINVYSSYKEEIQNGSNKRTTEITPKNNTLVNVKIKTSTSYKYTDTLKYGIQVDYSGQTEYKDEEGRIKFEDNGCTVVITKVAGYEYIAQENKKTLEIDQKYEPDTEYNFNIYINCQ